MFRIRTILILITLAVLFYGLSPTRRKQRIRGKLREVWVATVLALVLYWVFMLAAFAWEHWSGS